MALFIEQQKIMPREVRPVWAWTARMGAGRIFPMLFACPWYFTVKQSYTRLVRLLVRGA